MKEIIEYEIDGKQVAIEVDASVESTTPKQRFRGEREGDAFKKAGRFADALESVMPAAEAVLSAFKKLDAPGEIGLEFGLKFGAKAGAFLASADSEATFKVSLKWTKPMRE